MTTHKAAAKKAAKKVVKKTVKSAAKKAAKKVAKAAKSAARSRAAAPRTIDEIFDEVEARAVEVGVELRGGASAREIARTEEALGLTLPADGRAWYARHDGTAGDDSPYLWPLALIREQRRSFIELLAPHEFILGGVEDLVSYIDLSPEGAGRVFDFSVETGSAPRHDGFLAWLVSFDWDWDLDCS